MAEERHQFPAEEPSSPSESHWEHISHDPREGGVIVDHAWQPLTEVSPQEEDLVSIFQDDFETGEKQTAQRDRRQQAIPAPKPQSAFQSQLDTQPVPVRDSLANWAVGPEIPVATQITFYLAPRQTTHFLIGGLSRQLRQWLPAICATYGWELDLLSVRPDYLKWTLRDFPEALTREMLLTVREKTSQRIFRVFPNLRQGASSPDFWAPGYLVDSQNRDFSTQALMAHVARNRLETL